MAKNIIAVIQARITSKRFPGKVLKKLFNDMTVIDLMYKRLSTSKNMFLTHQRNTLKTHV